MNPETLCALMHQPAAAALEATAIRNQAFGPEVRIEDAPALAELPEAALVVRSAEPLRFDLPLDPALLQAGDTAIVHVAPNDGARQAYARWLLEHGQRLPPGLTVAPFGREPAGLHRLWSIAATRIALPTTIRVAARHDLLGIRLAQIALGFGADTLTGPLAAQRRLPVAGVTRPNENTLPGMTTLVQQAGLRVDTKPAPSLPNAEAS